MIASLFAGVLALLGLVACLSWVAENGMQSTTTEGGRLLRVNMIAGLTAGFLLLLTAVGSFRRRNTLSLAAHIKFTLLLSSEILYLFVMAPMVWVPIHNGILVEPEIQPLQMIIGWFALQTIILLPLWFMVLRGLRHKLFG